MWCRTVLVASCVVCLTAQFQYYTVPEPTIQALKPKGLRVSIPGVDSHRRLAAWFRASASQWSGLLFDGDIEVRYSVVNRVHCDGDRFSNVIYHCYTEPTCTTPHHKIPDECTTPHHMNRRESIPPHFYGVAWCGADRVATKPPNTRDNSGVSGNVR
uniref:Secreted protein n=1 Tax=Timema bartmani TaxID=61472 RepID=A0A7R9ERJ7_9NEOP|nr:unnamed protein product [Timema bartmani]